MKNVDEIINNKESFSEADKVKNWDAQRMCRFHPPAPEGSCDRCLQFQNPF